MPFRVFRVLVQGPSMAPALRSGDQLLVRRVERAAPGAVVVVALPERGLAVKRLRRVEPNGALWVEGDNALGSTDSGSLGALPPRALVGVVVLRLWPRPGRVRSPAPTG